ncbi:acyl-CoA dehydrogenase family protein [Alkalicoccobacillus porphyridii]|uniref:Acyl-CoA dehydrogenase n=1 Tax=Alkalicoccobacillus porphyridii TaxID=2597270 RepID=A0A553ZUS6_9BACI|nr:acyl-CoA dehydrogenase family protein [Alkalicoccobacillus porphyridii]TSB45075.1 acyl-CoA dehydrogenase [Alkalicoccobacillus porphyridii]
MSKNLFATTAFQRNWLQKLENLRPQIEQTAQSNDETGTFPAQHIQALVNIGYTSLPLPEEYGGAGLRMADLVLFQETLGSMDGATALSISWHQGVLAEIFDKKIWTAEQLSFLAEEVRNGAVINRAVSEAQTGSPTRGGKPGTQAMRDGDSWVINGEKTFTTMSPYLTYYLVGVWIEEKQTVGFFLIHRDTPGLSIRENWNMVGMRSTESHNLLLKDVRVDDWFLVEVNQKQRGAQVNAWMTHIPANYLGIAQAARDYAVKYATEHSPNSITGTISELPNVQASLGEIDLLMMQSRHLIYSVTRAYDSMDTRHLIQNEIGAVKHTVVNNSIAVVDKAMRVVGAKSLELSCPLQRHYRDIRAGLHNPPMDDMTISKLAQSAIEEFKA